MTTYINLVSKYEDKGIKEAQRSLENLSKGIGIAFAAVGAATVAAGIGITKFSIDAAKSGSNLSESLNAVRVSYGDASDEIIKLGETAAKRLGVTQTEFNAATVRFSAFAERIVGDGGNVAGFIDDITTRATDFASVFNIDVAEALQVFQSGLSGEAEPLKRFGINLLDSEVKAYAMANGIGQVGKELTETEKVQARYGLLLQSTSKVQGDFANTSEGLANRQRILQASFKDLEAQIGITLLPAFEDILEVVQDDLFPIFQDMAKKAGPALADAFKFIAEVINEAFTEGTDLNIALRDLGGAFDLLFTAVTNGQRDAKGFADFLANLVRVIDFVVTTLASLIAGFQGIGYAFEALKKGDIATFWKFLTTDTIDFATSIEDAESAVKGLNNVDLSKFRSQLGDIRVDGEKIANQQRELAYYLNGGKPGTYKPSGGGGGGGGGGDGDGGPTPAEQFKKVQGIIKQASDKMWDAQKRYQDRVSDAQKDFAKTSANIAEQYSTAVYEATIKKNADLEDALIKHTEKISSIQQEAQKKLADIVADSKKGLTDAYYQATALTLSDVFKQFNDAEKERRKLFDDAKKDAEKDKKVFTDVFTAADPIEALRTTLANQVASNKKLAEQSAALFGAGFSQTFIEQMISAGDDGGMAITDALLNATPETRASIQSLFAEIETQSQTGLDSLADQIYKTAGLATQELKNLYAITEAELVVSLEAQQVAYENQVTAINDVFNDTIGKAAQVRNRAMAEATAALNEALLEAATDLKDALAEIDKEFRETIKGLGGELAGLGGSIQELLNKLSELRIGAAAAEASAQAAVALPPSALNKIIAPTPAPFDIDFALGQAPGTFASSQTQAPVSNTVINVNVATDPTQSPAMVGKAVGNVITKYVTTGGRVAV